MKTHSKTQRDEGTSSTSSEPQGSGKQSELGMSAESTESQGVVNEQATQNEGEGSRTPASRDNPSTEQSVRSGKVAPSAREGQEAYDGEEGDKLRNAEAQAKHGIIGSGGDERY